LLLTRTREQSLSDYPVSHTVIGMQNLYSRLPGPVQCLDKAVVEHCQQREYSTFVSRTRVRYLATIDVSGNHPCYFKALNCRGLVWYTCV